MQKKKWSIDLAHRSGASIIPPAREHTTADNYIVNSIRVLGRCRKSLNLPEKNRSWLPAAWKNGGLSKCLLAWHLVVLIRFSCDAACVDGKHGFSLWEARPWRHPSDFQDVDTVHKQNPAFITTETVFLFKRSGRGSVLSIHPRRKKWDVSPCLWWTSNMQAHAKHVKALVFGKSWQNLQQFKTNNLSFQSSGNTRSDASVGGLQAKVK